MKQRLLATLYVVAALAFGPHAFAQTQVIFPPVFSTGGPLTSANIDDILGFSPVSPTDLQNALLAAVTGELPTGTIDGSNVTFTLAHTPLSSVALYFNGIRQRQGPDYTVSGATITFASAPDSGGLLADYRY
jgi:hypothetical protein